MPSSSLYSGVNATCVATGCCDKPVKFVRLHPRALHFPTPIYFFSNRPTTAHPAPLAIIGRIWDPDTRATICCCCWEMHPDHAR